MKKHPLPPLHSPQPTPHLTPPDPHLHTSLYLPIFIYTYIQIDEIAKESELRARGGLGGHQSFNEVVGTQVVGSSSD